MIAASCDALYRLHNIHTKFIGQGSYEQRPLIENTCTVKRFGQDMVYNYLFKHSITKEL